MKTKKVRTGSAFYLYTEELPQVIDLILEKLNLQVELTQHNKTSEDSVVILGREIRLVPKKSIHE